MKDIKKSLKHASPTIKKLKKNLWKNREISPIFRAIMLGLTITIFLFMGLILIMQLISIHDNIYDIEKDLNGIRRGLSDGSYLNEAEDESKTEINESTLYEGYNSTWDDNYNFFNGLHIFTKQDEDGLGQVITSISSVDASDVIYIASEHEQFEGMMLVNLFGDVKSEFILYTNSGGAHCYNHYHIYSTAKEEDLEYLYSIDSGDGLLHFEDIDVDGDKEILYYDTYRFQYVFASGIKSSYPLRLFDASNEGIEDVSTQYPDIIQTDISSSIESLDETAEYLNKSAEEGSGPNHICDHSAFRDRIASTVAMQIFLSEDVAAVELYDKYCGDYADLGIMYPEFAYSNLLEIIQESQNTNPMYIKD